jgi:hypothetical protein
VWRHSWLSTTSAVSVTLELDDHAHARCGSIRRGCRRCPSIRLSLAASAIFSTSPALPTWYGIEVSTID